MYVCCPDLLISDISQGAFIYYCCVVQHWWKTESRYGANIVVTSRIWGSQISNISDALVGNKIVDRLDVVGASPVGAAPITSSFST